jgi:hypothetical protein
MVLNGQIGAVRLTPAQAKQLPMIGGEADILKILQLTPGVKGGVEGTSGMFVRGGGADQNHILIDGVSVYNVSHLFGFFSVFNAEAIQNFTLYKGSFPAQYGGRLSSVLDVKMKEGNSKQFGGTATVSLISSAITLEGPIGKGNSSFIVSARRTYLEPFAYLFKTLSRAQSTAGYFFYDLNGKINQKISEKSRIYLSIYNGLDKLHFKNKPVTDSLSSSFKTSSGWGNLVSALRFNHIASNRLFFNLTGTFSNYRFFSNFENESKTEKSSLGYLSGIMDIGAKFDADFVASPSHHFRFGASITRHRFNPGEQRVITTTMDTAFVNSHALGTSLYAYIENEHTITTNLTANYGIGLSQFMVKGRAYTSPQPRISASYDISGNLRAKLAVARMVQHVHLVSSSNIQYPTDLWVLANESIEPSNSWIYSAGLSLSLKKGYELSIEGYFKPMNNLVEYREGASFVSYNVPWAQKVEQGKGVGKGIEVLVNKTKGKLTGWIGYTLAFSTLQFPNINNGQPYPHKFDRRHDISVVAMYKRSKRFDIGATWVYSTGNALTLADERIVTLDGNSNYQGLFTIDYYSSRNAYRMPAYHRLDVSFNFHKTFNRWQRTLSFGLYNAYNKLNPLFVVPEGGQKPEETVYMQYSFFPAIPFINYTIRF